MKQQFEASVKRFREQDHHKAYTKRALRRSESGTEPLSFRGLKGMPKFHAKGHCRDSYTTNNQDGTVRLEGTLLKVPKLKQLLPLIMHRPLPEGAVIKNVTISREAIGGIFVSICFCYTITMDLSIRTAAMGHDASFVENLKFLGLDYSQKELYVDSEGNRAGYPHYYRKSEEKLARLQQKLSRMVKGSHNYEKQLNKIRKLHRKIANQRKDFLHKLSTRLVSRYDVIVVEDIDLRGMGQALHLGKNLHDNGFGMFREMLSYKLERKGSFLVKVDRKFASSQLCHVCHTKNPGVKDLDVRFWTCPACGHSFDRDRNAAMNLVQEGRRIFLEYVLLCMEREEAASRKAEALSRGRKKKKQPDAA